MRTELKYLVPVGLVPVLRARMLPFVKADPYAKGDTIPEYIVRSIYFDTPGLRYYDEKVAGLRNRKKLRIRAYNFPDPQRSVYLEIKRKVNMGIAKDRAPLRFADIGRIFHDPQIETYVDVARKRPKSYEAARSFYYHLHRHGLRSSVLVVYNREPYIGRIDPGLRITFDKALRSWMHPTLDDLYRDTELKPCLPGLVVMEVKFNGSFPFWLRPLLVAHGLRKEAVSKYVRCIDSHGVVQVERLIQDKKSYRVYPALNLTRY